MTTRIKLNHNHQTLTLTHITPEGYRGVLTLPTDPSNPYALEEVHGPSEDLLYRTEFFFTHLENHTDLTPYLIGMTRSAQRKDLANAYAR